MKQYMYQFAVRKPDEKMRKFRIEHDVLTVEEKLTQQQVDEIAKENECDVQVTYLGTFTPTKKEEILSAEFHTKEDIEKTLFNWEQLRVEEQNQDARD